MQTSEYIHEMVVELPRDLQRTTSSGEITTREQTKKVLKQLEEGNLGAAAATIKENPETLKYNLGLAKFLSLIPRVRFSKRIPKTNDALKEIINVAFSIYEEQQDYNELVFFAAAKCDCQTLKLCVNKIGEGINQTREGDSVLLFMIKYGNIVHPDFPNCIKILLFAGIDVNKSDYFGHIPILFLANLYDSHAKKEKNSEAVLGNIKKSIEFLLETKKVLINSHEINKNTAEDLILKHNLYDLSNYEILQDSTEICGELFECLIKKEEQQFLEKALGIDLDVDDGNSTFLQLCCEKNLKKAAKFLVEKGADLEKTTERNKKTPVEIAARHNNYEIFKELLNTGKITIDNALFNTFLQNRGKQIKTKFFDELLKYKNLDVELRSSNGNTPLHYAIIFSNSEAVLILLQRGASLLTPNDKNKSPLDYISAEDLEKYLNKCILKDDYKDINNGKYEIAMIFDGLVQESELGIIRKISTAKNLCHLLNHGLISSFIDLKWKLVENLYGKLLSFQIFFYAAVLLSYFYLPFLNILAPPLLLVYGVRIYSLWSWKNNKFHDVVDLGVLLTFLASALAWSDWAKYQLGVLQTLLMALSFHLFWRFSPKFSNFHAILVSISSQIVWYFLYIMVLGLFIASGSYIFFSLLQFEIVNTLLLFPAFLGFAALLVIITVLNVFINSQISSNENIKGDFRIYGFQNVLVFLDIVEQFYQKWGLIPSPIVFEQKKRRNSEERKKKSERKKNNKRSKDCMVHFLLNSNKFMNEKLHSVQLEQTNIDGLKKIVNNG